MKKFSIIWQIFAFITELRAQLGHAEIHVGSPAVIKTPDYPKSLGPQVQMEWSVSADPGFRIKIIFQEFNIPANHDCKQLFVNIAEADSTVMNKGDNRICGNHPKVFITKTSKVSIFLRSDSDPARGAVKNFVLRLEKTREKPTEFNPGQWAGKPKPIVLEKNYRTPPKRPAPRPPVPPRPRGPPQGPPPGMYNVPPRAPGYGPGHNPMSHHGPEKIPSPGFMNNGARGPPPAPPVRSYPMGPPGPIMPPRPPAPRGPIPMEPQGPFNRPIGSQNHIQADNSQSNYGTTGNILTDDSQSSKLEVEEKKKSSISYALPIGILAMLVLLGAALFLVKKFLITSNDKNDV